MSKARRIGSPLKMSRNYAILALGLVLCVSSALLPVANAGLHSEAYNNIENDNGKDKDKGNDDKSKTAQNQEQVQVQPESTKCAGGEETDGTCKLRMVTVEELATKTGEDGGKELWLSILGSVYNVSAGPEFYAPGSGYHIFAGRDATVPFITGNFTEEEATKHTDELTAAQLYALDQEWNKFYRDENRYAFLGFLCCRYYDKDGQPTEETLRVIDRVKGYHKIKLEKDRQRKSNRRKMMMTTTDKALPKKLLPAMVGLQNKK